MTLPPSLNEFFCIIPSINGEEEIGRFVICRLINSSRGGRLGTGEELGEGTGEELGEGTGEELGEGTGEELGEGLGEGEEVGEGLGEGVLSYERNMKYRATAIIAIARHIINIHSNRNISIFIYGKEKFFNIFLF
jgi:hypothetical protein